MAKPATQKKSIYSVHPGVLMTQKWVAELKQKTGRTLEDWLKHRFEITSLKDIDDEVKRWLKVAYDRDA